MNRSAESRARPVLPRFRFDRSPALLQRTAPTVLELRNKALLVLQRSPTLLRSRQALCGPAKEPFALFCSFLPFAPCFFPFDRKIYFYSDLFINSKDCFILTITYTLGGKLYVNLTNRCPNACDFCLRTHGPGVGDAESLWLDREPTRDEIWEDLSKRDLNAYPELIFCGYGEPTCRADDLFWLCDQLRAAGRADLPPIRLNTNGQLLTPELCRGLDAVSVSLNGSNREEYLRLTRPGAGEKGWQAMLDFVRQAVQYVPKVMVSIVDYDKSPQEMEACRRLAEELGATFRVRPFAG
mgnify:CR=1 FL=1